MAYADQEMSGSKITAIIVVALIHIAVGYVLITGLAYEAVKNVVEKVTTVDIEEEVPEEEPPPPPEEVEAAPPPVVVPIPPLVINKTPPPTDTTDKLTNNNDVNRQVTTKTCDDGKVVGINEACGEPTRKCPDGSIIPIGATCPEPVKQEPLKPKGNAGSWVTNDDYRPAWVRREMAGTVGFTLQVTDGKVTGCSVTRSSGFSELDSATCSLLTRRARFNKASGSFSNSVRWQIPEE